MDAIKKQVEKHIRTSDTQKAFDVFVDVLDTKSSSYNDLIIIEAEFNLLGKERILGKMSSDSYFMKMNDINARLLQFCRAIPLADYVQSSSQPIDSEDITIAHTPYYLIQRASNHRKAKRYDKALADLQIASEQQPLSIAIQNDLAITHRFLGDHKEAIYIFENIIEKRPNDVQSLNELAICCREIERYNAALSALEKGLKLQPDNNHLHSNAFFTHLFFTLNKSEAADIWGNYEKKYGKPLIKNELPRAQFNAFLTHFDALHALDADAVLIEQYIQKCLDLRAFSTARFLFLNMEKQSKCLEIVKKYNRL
jgi:tetratricopeptide (TPR) repeat protein